VVRGKRKKTDADDKIPCILEPELSDKAFRNNWARLIQKICEVDPLLYPKCSSEMRVIVFIEDPDVINKNTQPPGPVGCEAKAAPDSQCLPASGGPRSLMFSPHMTSSR
jgi:hypothetical protein